MKVGIGTTYRSNHVSNMADAGTTCSPKVENFSTGLDPNLVKTSKNSSCQLAAERIPHAILDFHFLACLVWRTLHGYPLLTIHRFTRCKIFGNKEMFLPFSDEYALMPVRLDDYSGSALSPAATTWFRRMEDIGI